MKPSDDTLRNEAVDWLLRQQSSALSEAEQSLFENWLAQSPAHQSAYHAAKTQWDWMEQFKSQSFPARNAALSYRKTSRKEFFAYGSAATLLIAAGLTAFTSNGWLGSSDTYRVAKGEHQTIRLTDGSSIDLNTDSEVRVNYNRWHRQVELLRGEAFFTVSHNPRRPFEVKAGHGKIHDIGTAFDIYIQPEHVLVAVQEGVVEIETSTKKILHAGQQISFNQGGFLENLPLQSITTLTAWRQGKLVFKAKPLAEVLVEMGRYHDTTIKLQNPALANLKVSGTFNTDKLDNSLNAIASILPVKIEHISSREIVLKTMKSR